MKRVLATLIATALVVLTAGELSRVRSVAANDGCAAVTSSCCGHSHQNPEKMPPSESACGHCCLMCCVMIAPPVLEIAAPPVHSVAWAVRDVGGQIRTDKPPLPPPRVS
jgi:hypothetical protein